MQHRLSGDAFQTTVKPDLTGHMSAIEMCASAAALTHQMHEPRTIAACKRFQGGDCLSFFLEPHRSLP